MPLHVDEAHEAYLRALLRQGIDEAGNPLDECFAPDDFARESLESSRKLVQSLQDNPLVKQYLAQGQASDQFGHDLALTRNGHRTGFWDRGLGELGDESTALAKKLGTEQPYKGDDGRLYLGECERPGRWR